MSLIDWDRRFSRTAGKAWLDGTFLPAVKLVPKATIFIDFAVASEWPDRKNKILVQNYMHIYYGILLAYNALVGIWFRKFITLKVLVILARLLPKRWFEKVIAIWIESYRYEYYRG